MRNLSFTKEQSGAWYIDLPEWKGSKADLQMVSGADKLLDVVSFKKDKVHMKVVLAPVDDFIRLRLLQHTPDVGGATYKVYRSSIVFPEEIWLCDVTKFIFGGYMPQEIYFHVTF